MTDKQNSGAVDLLACPFCGHQDAFVEQLDSDASVVICQGRIGKHSACLARGPVAVRESDDEEQPGHAGAIREWNQRALLAAPDNGNPDRKWPKITQPAKVGGTRFGVGCSSKSVVECAYRLFQYEVTPEKEAERCKRAEAVREGLIATALEVPRLNAVVEDQKSLIAELEARHAQPLAIVLPECRRDSCEDDDVLTNSYNEGWNACLDAVAALNAPAKP